MHPGNVFDNAGAALLVVVLLWLAKRVAATINQEQRKRCGLIVIGFYVFIAAFFLMPLTLASFGVYCIFGAIPIPWVLRAIYGAVQASFGATGMFEAAAILRRDPQPVIWAMVFKQLRAGVRQQLGLREPCS